MARNPFVDRMKVLGILPGEFQAAKTQAENYLRANDDKEEVDEAQVRAALAQPVSGRVWNEIKKDLGLTG
jgi:hypothetical protein